MRHIKMINLKSYKSFCCIFVTLFTFTVKALAQLDLKINLMEPFDNQTITEGEETHFHAVLKNIGNTSVPVNDTIWVALKANGQYLPDLYRIITPTPFESGDSMDLQWNFTINIQKDIIGPFCAEINIWNNTFPEPAHKNDCVTVTFKTNKQTPIPALLSGSNCGKIVLYPNPANNLMCIENLDDNGSLFYLYNSLGQEQINIEITKPNFCFSVASLPLGIYHYKIISGSRQLLKSGNIMVYH